jgi:uncharacterized protein with PQ loop repeat
MKRHEHNIDRLAKLNGVVSGIALYPQLIRTIWTGSTESLSFTAFGLIFLNSVIWVAYARHRGILPLLISSVLNTIAAAALMVLSI